MGPAAAAQIRRLLDLPAEADDDEVRRAVFDRVSELEKWGERFVRGAQETEAKLRAQAVEDELDRRAKTRLKEAESRVRGAG